MISAVKSSADNFSKKRGSTLPYFILYMFFVDFTIVISHSYIFFYICPHIAKNRRSIITKMQNTIAFHPFFVYNYHS